MLHGPSAGVAMEGHIGVMRWLCISQVRWDPTPPWPGTLQVQQQPTQRSRHQSRTPQDHEGAYLLDLHATAGLELQSQD